MPTIVWTDHRRRLVMMEGEPASYRLEVKQGDVDAMGHSHWTPTGLTWDLFTDILQSVAAWKPVELTPEELT